MVNHVISSSSSAHEHEHEEEDEGVLMPPPPGYHFIPTHSQLIEFFLMEWILGLPLSSNMIKEMDMMQQLDPQQLPLDEFTYCRKNEAYFITPTKERNTEGSRTILMTTSGYWKASKEEGPVYNSERIVGYKKTFVFYQGNEPAGEKTFWRMNEYRVSSDMIPADALDEDVRSKIEQYVACKIKYKKPESPAEPLQQEEVEDEDEDEQE